jgi:hypothetical protein
MTTEKERPMPIIMATTVDQFSKIQTLVSTLPDKILEQIESVKSGLVGIECVLKNHRFRSDKKIYLPSECRQISNFGDYVGCYCEEFFFKIKNEEKDDQFEYIFLKQKD